MRHEKKLDSFTTPDLLSVCLQICFTDLQSCMFSPSANLALSCVTENESVTEKMVNIIKMPNFENL